MELAIRWRDSDGLSLQLLSYGSEWTVGGGLPCVSVALPASERQQLLRMSDKTRGKVACLSGCVL